MKKIIIGFFCFIFLISCNSNDELCYYYENGNIKERYIYENVKDTTSYIFHSYFLNGNLKQTYKIQNGNFIGEAIDYYQNNNIKSIVPYKNGNLEGTIKWYYENGEIDALETYKNGRQHGIYTNFNQKHPRIVEKVLYVNDEQLIKIEEGNTELDGEEIIGISYNYLDKKDKDTAYCAYGSLVYDIKSHERKQRYCSYFEIFAVDTINFDEPYKVKIVFHLGIMKGHNIELYLGKINENFDFVDSTNIKVFRSENNTIEFNLSQSDYLAGNNLLTGKIRLFENGEDISHKYVLQPIDNVPYIFFKQFFIRSKQ